MLSYRLKLVLLTVLAVVFLSACGEKSGKEGAKSGGTAKGAAGVLATVNGKDITVDDLKAEAASLSPYAVRALANQDVREKVLDNLVVKRLIMDEADKQGLAKDPEVTKKLDELKNSLLIEMYVKKNIVEKVNVTDKTVRDFFDKNKQDLGSVRLSHILVGSEPEAEAVLAKAKAGEDFGKLAKEYSQDTKTRDKGGDLGYVQWKQFGSASLKDAAFKLKKGEISSIVQSQFGYHIMKVTDKKPASDADFASMKDELTKQVTDQTKKDTFEAAVKGLKDKAKVVTYKEAIESAKFGPDGAAPAQQATKEEGVKAAPSAK